MALYRKWRPKTFDEVKGQDAICVTLKNQIKSGRIGHAYLFCGTRGTGKTSVAKILARAVNCEHPKDGNPCNECASCRAILQESSMNVQEIDAASNNGVDNIRDIREQVQYPPTEGKYRVFIIDEVHMLSVGAFNALLKTLEEPPEYVIFILATTEVNKIPVTVLSRCQRYDFKRISVESISNHLKELTAAENIEIEERALTYIARCADGAMRDALSLLDECTAFHSGGKITYEQVLEILGAADIGTFRKLFEAAAAADTGAALKVLEEAFEQGKEMGQFVSDFLWYLRNLLIIKSTDDAEGFVDSSRENLQIMRDNAAAVSSETIMRYIRVFAELVNRMRFSPQKRVLTELALIRLTTPEMEETNDAILERISRLEKEVKELKENRRLMPPEDSVSNVSGGEKNKKGNPASQKVVTLPRAEYNDFMAIRNDWGKITSSLDGLYKAVFTGTTLEPGGEGSLCVVFPNETRWKFGSNEPALKALTDHVRNSYQKEFIFQTRAKKNGDESVTNYKVTEEELREAVHFPIEKTDEEDL